jgi:mannose-6-phosphate isomerase-like protein (cupin superfamily)
MPRKTTTGPTVLVRSEQSDNRVAVIESRIGADADGPPLHVHDFDEAFYVIEGELTFQLGDELLTAGSGELAFAPGGTPHTYANHSGRPAHFILVCTPAGFERYFDKIAARIAGVDPPPETGPIPEVTVVGPQIAR